MKGRTPVLPNLLDEPEPSPYISAKEMGAILQLSRMSQGVDRCDLAAALGVPTNRVREIEVGEKMIALSLYVSALYLLGYTLKIRKTHEPLL